MPNIRATVGPARPSGAKLVYTCPQCYDTFLFQPEPCPTCAAQGVRQQRSKRARERRASYDTANKVSETEFWQLLKWYPVCPCCGKGWEQTRKAIARDHIVPISRGGPNRLSNLQPLCQSCNLWKSDRLICFDAAFPGQVKALPATLHSLFRSLSDYQPADSLASNQLSLLTPNPDPRYSNATAEELEARTIELTWEVMRVEMPHLSASNPRQRFKSSEL